METYIFQVLGVLGTKLLTYLFTYLITYLLNYLHTYSMMQSPS